MENRRTRNKSCVCISSSLHLFSFPSHLPYGPSSLHPSFLSSLFNLLCRVLETPSLVSKLLFSEGRVIRNPENAVTVWQGRIILCLETLPLRWDSAPCVVSCPVLHSEKFHPELFPSSFVSILCSLRTVELNQRWLSLNPWTCWLRPSEFQVSRFPLFGGDPQ